MRLYLIGGKARQGKDTTGLHIKEYYEKQDKRVCIIQISSYVKQFAINYFDWDGNEETKPRQLLQELGTDIIRNKLGKDRFFIDRIIEDIEILSNFFEVFIITDVRLEKEFTIIGNKFPGSPKILVKRLNYEDTILTDSQKKHPTETDLDEYHYYDYLIENDTLDKLKEDTIKIIEEVESK